MKHTFLFLLTLNLAGGLPCPAGAAPTETAVRWITQSSEYKAVCEQTYAAATEKVLALAESRKADGPWAVVMDIDETVLNNAQYQVELNAKKQTHSQAAWEEWVKRKEAPPVPGAKAFIQKLRKARGVRIIFISNRFARNTGLTRQNLEAHGLVGKDDIFLLRRDRADKKALRRQEVFEGTGRMAVHGKIEVLAWFGDAANDFPEDGGLQWGRDKFILPNPVYGGW